MPAPSVDISNSVIPNPAALRMEAPAAHDAGHATASPTEHGAHSASAALALEHDRKTSENPLEGTFAAHHRDGKVSEIASIGGRNRDILVRHFNQFATMARQLEKDEDPAFFGNPLYRQAIEIQQKYATMLKEGDAPPPPKKDAHGDGHGAASHNEHGDGHGGGAPKHETFDIRKISSADQAIMDGVIRLSIHDLASSIGVEIVNQNIPIELMPLFGKSTEIVPRQLLEGYFKKLGGELKTKYAERILFEKESRRDQLVKIAELHNASIAIRESLTGKKAWNLAGLRNKDFSRDFLSTETELQRNKLLASRYEGKDVSSLTPEQRIQLNRDSLVLAITQRGNIAREIISKPVETSFGESSLISNAREKVADKRGKTETRIVYKIGGRDEVPDETDQTRTRKITSKDHAQYQLDLHEAQNNISLAEEKIKSFRTQRTKLSTEYTELSGKRADLERDLELARQQEASYAYKHLLTEGEESERFISARTEPVRDKDGKITGQDSSKAATLLEEYRNRYDQILERIDTANAQLERLNKLPEEIRKIDEAIHHEEQEKINTLDPKLAAVLAREIKAEQVTSKDHQLEMTDFVVGEKEGDDTYTNRLSHSQIAFLHHETREESVLSLDNFRNTLFMVEGNLHGQHEAHAVLPDHVLIPSLARAMGLSWSDLLGDNEMDLMPYIANGVINVEAISVVVDPASKANIEAHIKNMGQLLLKRLQANAVHAPQSNAAIGKQVLKERLVAASTGKFNELAEITVKAAEPAPVRRTAPLSTPSTPGMFRLQENRP